MTDSDRCMLLDGGLATELERRGSCLDDPLWSARVLIESPEKLLQLHEDYYRAGANCAITATYQATFPGLRARGLSNKQVIDVLEGAVNLACEARTRIDKETAGDRYVAASIGPYGAFLHDGSEYRGNCKVSEQSLRTFHSDRFSVLAESNADWLVCETLPELREAEVLLRLLEDHPHRKAMFCFSCRDGEHISDGTPIKKCGRLFSGHPQVLGIGVNCTPPRYVDSLVEILRQTSDRPIVVYPNSGEVWDVVSRRWHGENDPVAFAEAAMNWKEQGAAWIGGCCRTGPEHIRELSRRLKPFQEG